MKRKERRRQRQRARKRGGRGEREKEKERKGGRQIERSFAKRKVYHLLKFPRRNVYS